MKSKKFVLAALALLAITGLLALAGCKNDSVSPEVEKQEQTNDTNDTTNTEDSTSGGNGGGSETDKNNTAAKLVSISVNPPTRTVYSEGQEFDHTDMVVTATYDDGESKDVTDLATTNFDTVADEKGLNKPVTVSYKEGETSKSDTFTVTVFPAEVKVLTGYTSPNNTGSDWTYVAFGEWPQSEASGVSPTLVAPQPDNLFKDKYYSDANGEYVKEGDKYYKVEPIVWRVLTTSYEAPEGGTVGEILLLAEKILTGGIKWADSSNIYMESYIRKWLNGNNGTEETSDYGGAAGFLQTAFTQSARGKIADTSVDNSAASTTDKIFLLSEQEATNSDYGFDEYDRWVGDDYGTTTSTRIRDTTDYAEATGASPGDSSAGYGGWWWLRSPSCNLEYIARVIDSYGYVNDDYYIVGFTDGGVVPALSISLGGN